MRRILVIAAAALLVAGVAAAQVHYSFHCSGSGNMVQDSVVIYDGDIDADDLAPGYWRVTIDDTGWPDTGDWDARWAYLWTNHYAYDPGPMVWTGSFFGNHLYLEKYEFVAGPVEGSMQGVCDMTFQIIDWDGDGELDPDECMDGLSGAVIIIEDGTGIYATLCGDGTYSGSYFRDCIRASSTWMQDDVEFQMQLDLEECGMGNEPSTWGAIKGLFE